MDKTVCELFAGVGGFRVGLNDVKINNDKLEESSTWDFVFANQWEPATTTQPAFDCYEKRFGNSVAHSNEDIAKAINKVPKHNLLVGGFPCQDYSVARSLSKEKGIEGKKGILWWEINKILKNNRPPFVLLENVDRLLKSPSTQRGRDFAIMLKSFDKLDYAVEWRVINAAEYGLPQKRKRVFIFASHKSTNYNKTINNDSKSWINKDGFFAKTFKVENDYKSKHGDTVGNIKKDDLITISNNYIQLFRNSGIMKNGEIYSIETKSVESSESITLGDILEDSVKENSFYLNNKEIEKYKYLKGAKKIERAKPNGVIYYYSEGAMSFPDSLDKPGRTMLTSEATTNRSTHVVKDKCTGRLRKITPIEAERLNCFPDNWTNTGMTTRQRYFMMGNALVTGIIKILGKELEKIFNEED